MRRYSEWEYLNDISVTVIYFAIRMAAPDGRVRMFGEFDI